jgi:hypothetical protein
MGMCDIIDLIRADYLHIMRWAAQFGELGRQDSEESRPALASTWLTLASLIDLHMRADDEICGPVVFGTAPRGRALARQARAGHEDIREMIGETSLYPPGSPPWWHLARAALAAWAVYFDQEEHGALAEYRHRADPLLRNQLATRWRAFAEAQIRDQYPQPPPQIPTCQLRQDGKVPPGVPQLAAPAFGPLACTCQDCTDMLDRAFGPVTGRHHAPGGPTADVVSRAS